MRSIKVLKEKTNTLERKSEGQKFEESMKVFIELLYEPTLKENSYHIKDKINMDENLKKFMNTCRKFIRTYANNIKRSYDIDPKKYLLDEECENANIYLYIVESLYYFYVRHCNLDLKLFEGYINDLDKTYINSEGKKYTFIKFIYMSVERMIKEENKLHEKSFEKQNINVNKFARVDLDAIKENEEGREVELDVYSLGVFSESSYEDIKTEYETLQENKVEMLRVQNKLLEVLTKAQMEFITQEVYGCYYDSELDEFIVKEYKNEKQTKNQFYNMISKRLGREIRPHFIKKHGGKLIDDRRANKRTLEVKPSEVKEYKGQHSQFMLKDRVAINNISNKLIEQGYKVKQVPPRAIAVEVVNGEDIYQF